MALQPLHGHRADWDALAAEIETAPPGWRWWIRRHPASRPDQDAEFSQLLSLRSPQVRVAEASALPLPVLLHRMSAVLSLSSGTAAEAAMFGVPAFFLSKEASGPFTSLIDNGGAAIITVNEIRAVIANLPKRSPVPPSSVLPDLDATLTQLEKSRATMPLQSPVTW